MASNIRSCRSRGKSVWRPFAVLFVLAVLAVPGQQQQGRSHKRDAGEIARQNRITEQILAQFLHRRLFPHAAAPLLPGRHGQTPSYLRRPWPVAAPATWDLNGGGGGTAGGGVIGGGSRRQGGGGGGSSTRDSTGGGSYEDTSWEEEYYDSGDEEGRGEDEGGEEGGGRDEGGGGKEGEEDGGRGHHRWRDGEEGAYDEEDSGRGGSFNLLGDGRVFWRGRGRGGEDALETGETENISAEIIAQDCANCVDDSGFGNSLGSNSLNRWTMPLLKLGEKRYYLGIFFKANWYRAAQYCRYHGMHLASIESQEESDKLEKHIRDYGLGLEHFWTSGTDQGEEGTFFWLSNGRPVTYTNWNAGEPNNFRYENGEEEHCLELWNRDGKGLKWNDTPCSFETYFVCEVQ